MAVPKRRQSLSRTNKRRSAKKISNIQYSICPQCGSTKLPHRICGECGYYNKKQIINKDKEN
ncbi:MAG: 50S ribosomal protein L32 [Elusimicrobia bacterium]|nr:50S ribosomal protein L32 [Elusimicrobiota bacterium]